MARNGEAGAWDENRDDVENVVRREVALAIRAERHRQRRVIAVALCVGAFGYATFRAVLAMAQAGCVAVLPSPMATLCPGTPAVAATVNGNFKVLSDAVTKLTGTLGGNDISTRNVNAADVTATGTVRAGNVTVSSGTVSAEKLAATGDVTVGGSLRVTGTVNAGCPKKFPAAAYNSQSVDMKQMGTYCITYSAPPELARNMSTWHTTAKYCVERGLRMCEGYEISVAAKIGAIQTYSASDHWAWSSEGYDGNANGDFGACHVSLNANAGLGDMNCQVSSTAPHGSIEGLCCF